ncbi:hypothetical protein [Actinocorallia sp. A-T 12471]|uniref:hypothetical protein n=1 Tax=Actinocorallia sp. A-T 12471 TaxID=3089813 RepID=UPI0029CCAEBD|nr:hypothetical protein [Actinocorallia sp. A-T 12471]MDX6741920.1 hypothetical protein [Actinocorallia sp. A-T 12471]
MTGGDVRQWTPAGWCVLFSCDVISYGDARRTDEVQEFLREGMYRALEASFTHVGIPFGDLYLEDRGDGVISAVPAEHDPALLVTAVFDGMKVRVKRRNRLASEVAQMRLRAAVHLGVARYDGRGLVGTDVNHLCRLLDAPAFKDAIRDSDAPVALIASERFYDDVIRKDIGVIDVEEYHRLHVSFKETSCPAWIRIPPTTSIPTPP